MNEVDINREKVAKSFFWKILERVFSQGVSFVVQIVLARLLLPEDFGSLAIIVAFTNYALIFVQSGITTAVIQKKQLDKRDLSTMLTYTLSMASVFYILLFYLAPVVSEYYAAPILKPALRLLSLTLFLQGINSVQTGLLTRQMNFKQLFYRTVISVPIAAFTSILMAFKGMGLWSLIAYSLINQTTIIIVMSFIKDLRIPLGFSMAKMKEIFPFMSKIILTYITCGLFDLIRTMMIGKRYTRNSLAYYDKGLTYSSYVTSLLNQSMGSVLLPAFSRKQDDVDALKQMARRSVRVTAFMMIPILIFVVMAAKPLVMVLLTEKWLPCVPFLVIYCFLRIPGPLLNIDKQVFYALGKSEVNLYYEMGLFVCNFVALFIAIRINVLAIAVGALIVELLGAFAIFIASSKVYNYTLWERSVDLWKPLLGTGVMAACLACISCLNIPYVVMIILQLCVGVTVYLSMSKITKDDNLAYCVKTIKGSINRKRK